MEPLGQGVAGFVSSAALPRYLRRQWMTCSSSIVGTWAGDDLVRAVAT